MREVILPLVVIALVAMAGVARRVLRPMLSGFIVACAAVSVLAYAGLEVVPWVRSASFFQPIQVQIEPRSAFGARADGQPMEIAVQIFRGSQLLEERRIPGLGTAVTPPAAEPLRLKPLESGEGFQVMAGATPLGELSSEALAAAGVGADLLPELAEPSPEPKPEIDVAAGEMTPPTDAPPVPDASATEDVSAAPKKAAAKPRAARIRRTSESPQQSEADREVELRARASQLSRQGSNCEAERLLREQGRDERSLALARELEARCRWKGR